MGGDLIDRYDAAFTRLAKSKFRSRFHLSEADRSYIAEMGWRDCTWKVKLGKLSKRPTTRWDEPMGRVDGSEVIMVVYEQFKLKPKEEPEKWN